MRSSEETLLRARRQCANVFHITNMLEQWSIFACLLHSAIAFQYNAAQRSGSSVRSCSKTCTLRMSADSEDAPPTKPRTQQEIRREVQAAIAEANYQVAGKMMSYQVTKKKRVILNLHSCAQHAQYHGFAFCSCDVSRTLPWTHSVLSAAGRRLLLDFL
jgi:hypothetical protein